MKQYLILQRQRLGRWFVERTIWGIQQEIVIREYSTILWKANILIAKINNAKTLKEVKKYIKEYEENK